MSIKNTYFNIQKKVVAVESIEGGLTKKNPKALKVQKLRLYAYS